MMTFLCQEADIGMSSESVVVSVLNNTFTCLEGSSDYRESSVSTKVLAFRTAINQALSEFSKYT